MDLGRILVALAVLMQFTNSNIRRCDGMRGSPGKSQKEGQEDQGTLKQLGRRPSCFTLPWSSWPSFLLFSGLAVTPSHLLVLEFEFQASLRQMTEDLRRGHVSNHATYSAAHLAHPETAAYYATQAWIRSGSRMSQKWQHGRSGKPHGARDTERATIEKLGLRNVCVCQQFELTLVGCNTN